MPMAAHTGTTLLALLALLHSRSVLLLTVLLAEELSTLKRRFINSSLGLSAETSIGHERALLNLVARVKELEQAVGAADLIEVGRVAGITQTALSLGLLALLVVTLLLGLLLLTVTLTSLTIVGLVSLLLSVVIILKLADGSVLLLLLGLELGTLITEAGKTLVGLILLSLDGVNLSLDLVVLIGESSLLRVIHAVLDLLDLGAEVVNLLLRILKLTEVLADLTQAGDVRQGLLLIDQSHCAGVDLLVEGSNLGVDLLKVLVGDLGLCRLLLIDSASDLLIEALDLVELRSAGVLSAGLLLSNLVGLSNKLLSSLLGRVGLVLVLVWHSNVNLSLDSSLEESNC
ncbi:hypothetical protein HG530_010156 [Fusarium avenaceum]|nr:hypothetical protein HG530_010156 [Fusarium avenaceum]